MLAGYLCGVLAAGGLAAYPVHGLLHALGADPDFAEVLRRTLKLLAVVGLWPLLAWLGMHDRRAWGFARSDRGPLAEVALGLALGIASLGVLGAFLLAAGIRVPVPGAAADAAGVARLLVGALLTGMAVALVEELWFRGALHSLLRAWLAPGLAIGATALLYGAVHFFKPGAAPDPVGWDSGWALVAGAFWPFGEPAFADTMPALVVVGVLLGAARERTGRIWLGIGLHAGWVVVIRVLRKTTSIDPGAPWAALVGSYDGVIGPLAGAWLAALGFAAAWWLRTVTRRAARP